MICVDFNHKSRSGMPFEGLTPNELSECDFNCVNARWEKFFREKKDILSALAFGDEDLVDIGLLAVRGHLCRFPDCPDSWLIRRAKLDMLSARKWGQSLDAPKRERKRQNPEKDSDPTREGRDFDRLEYQAYLYCGRNPETVVIDRLQYEAFWRDLSEMERQLVAILKEEVADRPRYFNGRYVPVERKKGKAKKRFRASVSTKITDYTLCYANARLKFFLHFGDDAEIRRERKWFESFDPYGRLHVNRGGHYDRKGRGK